MTSLDIATETAVARPLKVLIPLIKEDFEEEEKSGMPHRKAAGEKLNEARDGHFDGNTQGFFKWAENTFGKKPTYIRTCMALAASAEAKSFKTLEHFKKTPKTEGGLGHNRPARTFRDWTAPVDAVAERAREEQRRLGEAAEMTRREERKAEAQLGLRLIDIGYKVLARELHPDKVGGSREAMTRLNRVKDRLKSYV
jgi:hypothetical protein